MSLPRTYSSDQKQQHDKPHKEQPGYNSTASSTANILKATENYIPAPPQANYSSDKSPSAYVPIAPSRPAVHVSTTTQVPLRHAIGPAAVPMQHASGYASDKTPAINAYSSDQKPVVTVSTATQVPVKNVAVSSVNSATQTLPSNLLPITPMPGYASSQQANAQLFFAQQQQQQALQRQMQQQQEREKNQQYYSDKTPKYR